MTFWPRLAISGNELRNLVKVKEMFNLRPAPATEFQGGSCCGSQIGWRLDIRKILAGCTRTYSKAPRNTHSTGLHLGQAAGVG